MQLTALERKTKTRGDRSLLRANFRIPAVVYGHGRENQPISIAYREFEKLYAQAGTASLIDLKIEGHAKPLKVLISEVQRDPESDQVIHVDLHQVSMDEKIKTEIPIQFVGESPAVKELGANLIVNLDSLQIECLPNDLIASVTVDISSLKELDQSVHVRDLSIPAGITVLNSPDGSVVSVLAPREEVLEETPTPEAVVISEEKKAAEAAEAAATAEAAPAEKAEKKQKAT